MSRRDIGRCTRAVLLLSSAFWLIFCVFSSRCFRYLLSQGADVSICCQLSPFRCLKHAHCIHSQPNARNKMGWTCLHCCSDTGPLRYCASVCPRVRAFVCALVCAFLCVMCATFLFLRTLVLAKGDVHARDVSVCFVCVFIRLRRLMAVCRFTTATPKTLCK